MPSALVNRINLDLIYPRFLDKILDLLAECQTQGAPYYLTYGMRSFEEQDRLFAVGRTVPGKKVTNARGGESLHNFGLAVDSVRDGDLVRVGLQPEWGREGYETLWKEANALGLETGFMWKFPDAGHVQVIRPSEYATDGDWCRALTQVYNAAGAGEPGIKAVWAHLDSTLQF